MLNYFLPLPPRCARLQHETGASDPLWLVSPLTRAIETFIGSCPLVADRLKASGASGGADAGGCAGGGGGCGSGGAGGAAPNVVILGMIAEHCATCGDVGRPSSDLARAFPIMTHQLRELEEVWWYNPDPLGRPNCHR
jgi:hypothetical protein